MSDSHPENGAQGPPDQENGVAAADAAEGSSARGPVRVNVFGRTDVGLVRDHNEDNFLVADLSTGNRSIKPEVRDHTVGDQGSLFVVCDGMGGAAAGEVASRIAVDTIYEEMQKGDPPEDDKDLARRLNDAIVEAGVRIFTAAKIDRGRRGMGTTVTAAVIANRRLILGQVGDSRAHIIRDGELVQVTKDQSLVQQLIDAKQLTEEEARNFEKSNIILQALGTNEDVHVDVTSVDLRQGDALVMCSDGLSGLVEPDAILAGVVENEEPMDACRVLTEQACEAGGDDNITVVVARFGGDGLPPADEADDGTLRYSKFDYFAVTETTVRTPIPKGLADADQEEPQPEEAAPAPESAKKAEASKPEEAPADESPARKERPAAPAAASTTPSKGGAGLKIGIAAAVIAVIAVVAYVMSSGGEPADGEASEPNVVAPAPPEPPEPPPAPEPETPPPPPEPQPEAQPEEPREAPALAPTPEDQITGPDEQKPEAEEPRRREARPAEREERPPSEPEKPTEGGGVEPAKKPAAKGKAAADKPKKKKKKKPAPPDSPAPIEDNPF